MVKVSPTRLGYVSHDIRGASSLYHYYFVRSFVKISASCSFVDMRSTIIISLKM